MDKTLIEKYLRPMRPKATSLKLRGALRPPMQCLLCDVYGTLFVSRSGDINSLQAEPSQITQIGSLLRRFRQTIPVEDLLQRLRQSIQKHHAAARSGGIQYPEVQIEKIWQTILSRKASKDLYRFALEFEMIVNPVWPMPHLSELLNFCRQTDVHLGIISNAQFYTPLLFELFLKADLVELGFDPRLTIMSYQYGRAKPSATLFATARRHLREIGVSPGAAVYIGNDMRNDIRPAAEAGFQTVLFAGDARSLRLRRADPCCKAVKPDLVVIDLEQLISCLR